MMKSVKDARRNAGPVVDRHGVFLRTGDRQMVHADYTCTEVTRSMPSGFSLPCHPQLHQSRLPTTLCPADQMVFGGLGQTLLGLSLGEAGELTAEQVRGHPGA